MRRRTQVCNPEAEQAPARPGSVVSADELRGALARRELVVHFQPKIDLVTAELAGAEALVRWEHPARGLLHPHQFLPTAGQGNLLDELTWDVLDQSARQCREWQAAGLDLPISINLPPGSVSDSSVPHRIARACERHQLEASSIELEITETALLVDVHAAGAVLRQLRDAGFAIALDDFGTGFSSLAHLRNLPVSAVKIDKSFVLNLLDDDADAHMVRGITELARGLDKTVIAEGVESAEVADLLLLMGCDQGQGYHWSRPVAAHDFVNWLSAYRARDSHSTSSAPGTVPIPANEAQRVAALRRYRILDTAYEAIFDDIAAAAARLCGTSMSAISLVDTDRQWFKAKVGLQIRETTRNLAFCAHTITDPERIMEVTDATLDPRFRTNALVTGNPNIRYYAGAPLVTPDGLVIGSLCVIDTQPRALSRDQLRRLRQLSQHVINLLESKSLLDEIDDGTGANGPTGKGSPRPPQRVRLGAPRAS